MFQLHHLLSAMAVVPFLISETGGVTFGAPSCFPAVSWDPDLPVLCCLPRPRFGPALTAHSSESDPVRRRPSPSPSQSDPVQELRPSLEKCDVQAPSPTDEEIIVTHVQELRPSLEKCDVQAPSPTDEEIIVTHVQELSQTLANEKFLEASKEENFHLLSVLRAFWVNHTSSEDLFRALLKCLPHLDFNRSRKPAISLLKQVIRKSDELVPEVVVDYVRTTGIVGDIAARARTDPLHNYILLRGFFEMRSPALVKAVLEASPSSGTSSARSGVIFTLFETAKSDDWEIFSEALLCAQALLLGDPDTQKYGEKERLYQHKDVVASFVEENLEHFSAAFHAVIVYLLLHKGDTYAHLRMYLKLLGSLLLDRAFMQFMFGYVASHENLMLHMNLLKDDSKRIQLDDFHVFKIFVANPKKPFKVQQILFKNRKRLVDLLEREEFAGGECRDPKHPANLNSDTKMVRDILKYMKEPLVN